MPASDTAHFGVPAFPRSALGEPFRGWFEMAEYSVRIDDITDTYSTGATTLTNLPPDVRLEKISWRVAAPFVGSTEKADVLLEFGDGTNPAIFGFLNNAQLQSTNSYGEIPVNYDNTSTAELALTLTWNEPAVVSTCSSGTLEVWLNLRYNASVDRQGGTRAK